MERLPPEGRVDLVAELTHELPVRVLFALLGLADWRAAHRCLRRMAGELPAGFDAMIAEGAK